MGYSLLTARSVWALNCCALSGQPIRPLTSSISTSLEYQDIIDAVRAQERNVEGSHGVGKTEVSVLGGMSRSREYDSGAFNKS